MFKKILLMTNLLILCLSTYSVAHAKTHYINGIDANYPPFAFVDEKGKATGFDVDAINWIAKKKGFTVTHRPMQWSGIIPSLTTGKIDFIASGLSITDERLKSVDFTFPYWVVAKVLITKKGANLTPDNILFKKGAKIGIQSATSEEKWFNENMKARNYSVTLQLYDSGPLAIQDLLNGRVVAVALDSAPAGDAMKNLPIEIIGDFGSKPEKFGIGVRKNDPETKKMLEEGMKELMQDPYWNVLVEKWITNKK